MTYFHTVLYSARVLENEANEHQYLPVSAARQKNDIFYTEVVILHGSCNATAILTALNVILDRTTLCGSDSVVKIYGLAADFTLTWLF